mmetsp:Transcript_38226/g.75252  ORF Transcript_38226/g.75252 Transcript_38226/m.75252 type:complete len:415 (+) Transcript_38226:60-1304(+)
MKIQNLFILSGTGEVLIEKHWSGRVKRNVTEIFWEELNKAPKRSEVPPVIATPKYYLIHVQRNDLTFLSTVQNETPPLLILEIQHRIVSVLQEYLKKLSETKIRENFSTVLQLLDEMVDGGFPFTTESNQLKEMIVPPTLARDIMNKVTGTGNVREGLPSGALSKIPWRKAEVKYVQNEVYFDLIESLDVVIGSNGMPITSLVFAEVLVNCRLSGMPDLTFQFSQPSLLDDISLHRCVRIHRFQKERIVSFVPPDGHFKLLSYKIKGPTSFPMYCNPTIDYHKGGGKVHIMVGSKLGEKKPITSVTVIIPCPKMTKTQSLSANVGTVKFDGKTKICRWEIGKLPHDVSPVLEGSLHFPADEIPDSRPVVRLEFQAKGTTASGLKVDGLAIRGISYKPFKGVRSIAQAGRFEIRC